MTSELQPARHHLDPIRLARLDAALRAGVDAGLLPGGVVRVECGPEAYEVAVGRKALVPTEEPLAADAVYDCASLTKVVVTATLMAKVMEVGAVRPDTPIRSLLPQFESDRGASPILLAHLLTHTSGLPAGLPSRPNWQGREAGWALAANRQATHPPGAFFRYSDVNFILLGQVAERVSGVGLDQLAHEWIFRPLGMRSSGYRPLDAPERWAPVPRNRIAPTEWDTEGPSASDQGEATRMLRGEVHDPTARRMGGVAGHAGLFSTAQDLARFARMVLSGGELDGVRVLSAQAVDMMTAVATPPGLAERRSLGWDIDSPYSRARGAHYRPGSFGHTGFTGCSLWIDRSVGAFHVFLSNRVHPRARESIVGLYEQVGTLAAAGVRALRAPDAAGGR